MLVTGVNQNHTLLANCGAVRGRRKERREESRSSILLEAGKGMQPAGRYTGLEISSSSSSSSIRKHQSPFESYDNEIRVNKARDVGSNITNKVGR